MRFFLLLSCLLAALLLPSGESCAALTAREEAMAPLYEAPCRRFGIPRALAMAIARQESDASPLLINIEGKDVRPGSLREALRIAESCREKGLSFDVGLMQINSYWIRRYHIPLRLLFRPRDNIYMACFILADSMRRDGMT